MGMVKSLSVALNGTASDRYRAYGDEAARAGALLTPPASSPAVSPPSASPPPAVAASSSHGGGGDNEDPINRPTASERWRAALLAGVATAPAQGEKDGVGDVGDAHRGGHRTPLAWRSAVRRVRDDARAVSAVLELRLRMFVRVRTQNGMQCLSSYSSYLIISHAIVMTTCMCHQVRG